MKRWLSSQALTLLFLVAAAPVLAADVQVVGATVVPTAELAEAARRALGDARPEGEALRKVGDAVRDVYKRRGYPLAQLVSAELQPDGVLRLTVAEGRVRNVAVLGNKKTRTSLVREALFLQPGIVYRDDTAAQDRDRLYRLGIFDDVLVSARTPEGGDEIGFVDLVVRVKEGQTGNVAATVGYDDLTGLVGFFSLSEANAFGRAEKARVDWQRWSRLVFFDDGSVGSEAPRQAFNFTYGRPALGPRGIAFEAAIYDQNTVFLPTFSTNVETIRNYERRRGGSLRVGRRLQRIWSGFVTARRDRVGYDPIPDSLNPPVDELARASATVGAVGALLTADGRDRAENPHHGFLYQLSHEQAGSFAGGNRNFSLSQVDVRRYAPMRLTAKREATVAGRILAGWSGGDVPLSEQFFLGGFDLLRGYDIFSIRGDRMVLASGEVRVPMGPGLAGVLFADYGGAWAPGVRASVSNLKAGVGVGVRFASPVGPIRFDIAYGRRVQTYISLGQAF